jgi:flagellar motility protein MotE (MotC chaperone)
MTTEPGPYAESRAILIGVSAYEDAGFPPIAAARNSLRAVRALLEDPGLCGWPRERITEITNPWSAGELAGQVADLAEETTGVLLLYYVGHGVLTDQGELCLTVTSTRRDRPKYSGLPWETLAEILRRSCPARARLIILDCCFAGQAIEALAGDGNSGLADITHVEGVYTLTATTRNHAAHVPPPSQQDTTRTCFTSELCDLVYSGIPGKPAYLTLADIYPELRKRLKAKGLPTPNQRGTDTAGLYPFAANVAARTHPGPHASRPAPADTGQPGSTEQTSPRTGPTYGAAGQQSAATTDDILLLQTPGEAMAVREEVEWFERWDRSLPVPGARLAALEEMGAKRAALRINPLNARTAASVISQMHSGSAAATLSETDSSHAVQIVGDMDPAKAAGVLARMEPARVVDLLTHMDARRAGAIMNSLAPVLIDAVLATDIEHASLLLPGMEPSKAAAALARMEPAQALDLLTHMDARHAGAIMNSLAPVLIDAVLATDIEHASLLLPNMEPSKAAAALARMEPAQALDLLTRMPAPDAASIVGRMSDEMAATMLGGMPTDHAGATMGLLGLEKTVPVLETMPVAEARTVLESVQPLYAQHAMDPQLYAAIRVAVHPYGAFDMARAWQLRPWRWGAFMSAFAVTSTAAVLFWAVILPRWQGAAGWSWLVWLTGVAALGLGIFVASTATDRLVPLVVSTAGFSMTAAGLAFAVAHVLPVVSVTCALAAMAVSSRAIASGGFIFSKAQEQRKLRPLPDLPMREVAAPGINPGEDL